MAVRYTKDMAKAVRAIKPPVKDLILDIVKHPDYIALRVYEGNVMQYEINQRADIMQYLLLVKQLIETYGSRCEIEGVKYESRK
jgi:hypothetical protein